MVHVYQSIDTHLVLRKALELWRYCLKKIVHGRFVAISSITLEHTNDKYKLMASRNIRTLPVGNLQINLWPLVIKILVQILSPLLSPESSPWSSPQSSVHVCTFPKCSTTIVYFAPPFRMILPSVCFRILWLWHVWTTIQMKKLHEVEWILHHLIQSSRSGLWNIYRPLCPNICELVKW